MRWSDLFLQWADRYRRWALGILLIVYLAGFNGQWRPEPDSALYLTLAKNLATGCGYTYHGEPHHLAYPGWPWILAGVIRVTGHEIFVAHVLVFLMGLASLGLMYRLMLLHAGRAMAVLMTVGLGISHTFYRYCFEVRSDMPFMLGVMGVLAGYEGLLTPRCDGDIAPRRHVFDWTLLSGGLVLAITTRPTMWALLASLVLAIAWGIARRRVGKKVILAIALVAICAAAFLAMDPRRHASTNTIGDYEDVAFSDFSWPKLKANVGQLFDPMASEALFGIDFGQSLHVGPVSLQAVGSVVAIFVGMLIFRERALWGLWFFLTVAMMLFTLARDRYFLPVLPIMIFGWWIFIRQVNLRLPGKKGNVVFILLFALGAVANSAKVGELFIEQRHPNVLTAFHKGSFESIHRVAAMVEANVPAGGWVIAPKKCGRILTFLSGRNVTEPGDIVGAERSHDILYLLDPAEMDADSPLMQSAMFTVGPAITLLKGPYDLKPWVLHRITPIGAWR